jgi:hypothetical protein
VQARGQEEGPGLGRRGLPVACPAGSLASVGRCVAGLEVLGDVQARAIALAINQVLDKGEPGVEFGPAVWPGGSVRPEQRFELEV